MDVGCCGADCSGCGHLGKECEGCRETSGRVYWTEYIGGPCPICTCCIGKGYKHCGSCPEMPCDRFRENQDPTLSEEERESVAKECLARLRSLR